ncbi:hypothetical protein VN21_02275 [Paraclostridium benzoelyticum]|uniref:Uncharacterized protein n=1 Tax=Paraclostridium benzoelyticum TaxID=1629550 RepID=A0A0M3DJ48_9FIRM|nr:hypothetical protein [Paraclostridium benzoelyticum]KKY02605.1 hypothetical protein VN21_02275 [Paraclostridium benzoelyticum]
MKKYSYNYHILLSVISSCLIGIISFFIIGPSQMITSKGVIQSVDDPNLIHTQISYGYDSIFKIIIISLVILLVLYKPVKSIFNKRLTNAN